MSIWTTIVDTCSSFMIGFFYSLTFSFILVGPNGDPLSGEEALAVLERVDALNQLRARGYQVDRRIHNNNDHHSSDHPNQTNR